MIFELLRLCRNFELLIFELLRLCRNFELLIFEFIILSVDEFIHFISVHYSFHIGSSIIHNSTSITTIQNSIIQNSITQNRLKPIIQNSKNQNRLKPIIQNSKFKIQNCGTAATIQNSKFKNQQISLLYCHIPLFVCRGGRATSGAPVRCGRGQWSRWCSPRCL